jgi:nicotinamidase-related amidase
LTDATYDRLTRDNAVLLLVDHQVGLVAGSRYPEPQDLRKNVVGLTRASKILGVPIVATTMSDGMFGPIFPELAELLKDREIIDRSKVNPFDEPRITSSIKKTGRSKVIIAGVDTAVCTCFPAISARNAGYAAYAAIDASGALDKIRATNCNNPNDSGWSDRGRLQCDCGRDVGEQRGSVGSTSLYRFQPLCVNERYL